MKTVAARTGLLRAINVFLINNMVSDMGEIADQIISGEICQTCCMPLDDVYGFPVDCKACGTPPKPQRKEKYSNCTTKDGKPIFRKNKINCPQCNKLVKSSGLEAHIHAVHSINKD